MFLMPTVPGQLLSTQVQGKARLSMIRSCNGTSQPKNALETNNRDIDTFQLTYDYEYALHCKLLNKFHSTLFLCLHSIVEMGHQISHMLIRSQITFACSKSTIETLKKVVKYFQN